jgi:DNA-binding NtrC family response regulator
MMARLSVLVVDDDPIALESVRDRLTRAGYDVAIREAALGTSTWILNNRPDVVLLDVMMPALSGKDIAALLKKRGIDTVVILHSSVPSAELTRSAVESGAAGAMAKTSDEKVFLSEFARIVNAALGARVPAKTGAG